METTSLNNKSKSLESDRKTLILMAGAERMRVDINNNGLIFDLFLSGLCWIDGSLPCNFEKLYKKVEYRWMTTKPHNFGFCSYSADIKNIIKQYRHRETFLGNFEYHILINVFGTCHCSTLTKEGGCIIYHISWRCPLSEIMDPSPQVLVIN